MKNKKLGKYKSNEEVTGRSGDQSGSDKGTKQQSEILEESDTLSSGDEPAS